MKGAGREKETGEKAAATRDGRREKRARDAASVCRDFFPWTTRINHPTSTAE